MPPEICGSLYCTATDWCKVIDNRIYPISSPLACNISRINLVTDRNDVSYSKHKSVVAHEMVPSTRRKPLRHILKINKINRTLVIITMDNHCQRRDTFHLNVSHWSRANCEPIVSIETRKNLEWSMKWTNRLNKK